MAMYGIVSAETLRAGGMDLDDAIVNYVRRKFGVVIGQATAEQLKMRIGAAVPQDTENSMEVQGQDQVTGLPRRRASASSSRAISPPPMATISRLLATIAAEVGDSRCVPGWRPPQWASGT